jgi:hypothetical protein
VPGLRPLTFTPLAVSTFLAWNTTPPPDAFLIVNAILEVLSVGVTELFGPGRPDCASAVNVPYSVSASSGEVFSMSGTSVWVLPPLRSSVWTIGDDGRPAAGAMEIGGQNSH